MTLKDGRFAPLTVFSNCVDVDNTVFDHCKFEHERERERAQIALAMEGNQTEESKKHYDYANLNLACRLFIILA